jgi:hypothetical protein
MASAPTPCPHPLVVTDASAAEALLECVVQSLVTTGEHGKVMRTDDSSVNR